MSKSKAAKKKIKKTPKLDKVIKLSPVDEQILADAIQNHIKSKNKDVRLSKEIYKKWKVGITNDPDRRYKENLPRGGKILRYWKCWNAETKDNALAVEGIFCNKGFSRCRHSNKFETEDTIYIYAFLIPKKKKKKKK